MQKVRKLSLGLATVSLAFALLVPAQVVFADTTGQSEIAPISRLAGVDRYETAVKISQAGWADNSSTYAILSAGIDDNLVDALTAAPLAKLKSAPILLTEGDQLNPNTQAELKRLGVTTVYVTSGLGVITQPVLDELDAMNIKIATLGGVDRFGTALNIAKELGQPSKLVVATAYSNADALSIAAIAAAQTMPILLSNPDKLPDDVAAYINQVKSNVAQTYLVGGTGVLNKSLETDLPHPLRLGGKDRYETNQLVIGSFALTLPGDTAYVANGEDNHLVDALTGSVLAAKGSTAIALTSNPIQDENQNFLLSSFPLKKVVALGGDSAVSQADLEKACTFTDYKDDGGTIGGTDSANSLQITGNIKVSGNDSILQNADLSHNLYVTGNNVKLSHLNISGNLVLEPSSNGTVTLDHVTAKGIVIEKEATGTFQMKAVQADGLVVVSKEAVKVVSDESTVFGTTVLTTSSSLNTNDTTSTFGNVMILNLPQREHTTPEVTVQFAGTFENPILVAGQSTLSAQSGTTLGKIGIATTDTVNLQGTINKVDVLAKGNLEMMDDSKINTLTLYDNTHLTVAKTATVGEVVKQNNAELTLSGEGAQNVGSAN